jgi:hypothetical protein
MSYVVPLAEAAGAGIASVGGRATGISKLIAAGAVVPPGFCIRSSALADHLGSLPPDRPGGPDERADSAACMTAPLPPGLAEDVAQALTGLAAVAGDDDQGSYDGSVMVRSSALAEDTAVSRAPGVYTSLRVPAELASVLSAMRSVWASGTDQASRRYRARSGPGDEGARMAVIVQLYVPAGLGGAVSTIDPGTNDPRKIMISWVDGHPGELMSGVVPGSTVLLDKPYALGGTAAVPEQIASLPAEASRLEKLFSEPRDIEFVVSRRGVTYLVQCRPMPYRPGWRLATAPTADPVTSSELHSPKIEAVRLNNDSAADPFNRIVIWPSVFETYRECGSLPPEVRTHLGRVLTPLVSGGEVALRPAYWSALNSSDNMPQSGRLRSVGECLNHLEALFRYVIDNGLDDYSAEVAVLAGNWLPVVASAVAAPESGARVHVDAVAGYPEALERATYESRLVEAASGEVVVVGGPPQPVPALSVREYREAAAVTDALSRRLCSPLRVEILVVEHDGGRTMVVWQVDRLTSHPGVATFVLAAGTAEHPGPLAGRALKITSADDMLAASAQGNADAIVLPDASGMSARDRDGQILIAQLAAKLGRPVVVRGSPLSHLAALLREYGVAVYPVREIDQQIRTGDSVTVAPELTP